MQGVRDRDSNSDIDGVRSKPLTPIPQENAETGAPETSEPKILPPKEDKIKKLRLDKIGVKLPGMTCKYSLNI